MSNLRYMIFSPGNVRVKYLFTAQGISDSEFLHNVLRHLDFDEYSVKFTDKRPRRSSNLVVWWNENLLTTKHQAPN